MKQLHYLTVALCTSCLLALIADAGTESAGKEMTQTAAPPPPVCDWTGFYLGVHVGGQFGHSEDRDLDQYISPFPGPAREFGYNESGVVAGGQIGYNWQWHWLVLGPEIDLGYMNQDGNGTTRFDRTFFNSDTRGETESDFYMTARGRLGVALGKWLFYGTGGGIGVNYKTQVIDNCDAGPCGAELLHASKEDFNWGWTGGGGIEYMMGCHWTVKAEYLRYQLDDQSFSGVGQNFGGTFRFTGIGTEGNIFRAGLNYKF